MDQKTQEFHEIERDINRKLGQFSGIGSIMLRTCREYRIAIQLLKARGTPEFYETSVDLYGSASEAFYPGGPVLNDLSDLLSETLGMLQADMSSEKDEKKYTSAEAVEILKQAWKENLDRDFCGVIFRALSSSRQPAAIEFLLQFIREGSSREAALALEALKLHEDSPEIWSLVEKAKNELPRRGTRM